MIANITVAKGKLARNPSSGLAEGSVFASMCLVCDAGDHVVSLWVYAFGELAELIMEHLRKGDEVSLKAETKRNEGKFKIPRKIPGIGASNLLVISEIEVDGKIIANGGST